MSTQPIAINCGASADVTDAQGVTWLAERGFFDGMAVPDTGRGDVAPVTCRSEHYGMTGFWVPLPNGRYTVDLTFCENYRGITQAGQRVFNVITEGVPLNGIDPFAQAGGIGKPLERRVDVHVLDGKLDIAFENVAQHPQINAIRITCVAPERDASAPKGFDEPRDVPHGKITAITYHSKTLASDRPANVYTPPGYDATRRYPVLYLLHGGGGNQDSWRDDGRVAVIMDNLIAAGDAAPMIIVMPNGSLRAPGQGGQRPSAGQDTLAQMENDVVTDLVPYVESNYPVIADAPHRALAGLSMGAGQTLWIGPRHADRFAYLGAFAPAMLGRTAEAVATDFPDGDKLNAQLKLLWVACGKTDQYWPNVMKVLQMLNRHSVAYHWQPQVGSHSWEVWRESLYQFAPHLFREDR